MTDNEIIKALERLSAEDPDGFSADVWDLICRRDAEIETKNKEIFRLLGQADEKRLLQKMQQPPKHEAKLDNGKMRISIVPLQIVSDIAEVREYGIKKYNDPDNWKRVDIERYANALFRHFRAFLHDPASVDDESGIEHYKHMACNMAFICELMKEKGVEPR